MKKLLLLLSLNLSFLFANTEIEVSENYLKLFNDKTINLSSKKSIFTDRIYKNLKESFEADCGDADKCFNQMKINRNSIYTKIDEERINGNLLISYKEFRSGRYLHNVIYVTVIEETKNNFKIDKIIYE